MPIRITIAVVVLLAGCSDSAAPSDGGGDGDGDRAGDGDGDPGIVSLASDCDQTVTYVWDSATIRIENTAYYAILDSQDYGRAVLACGVQHFGAAPSTCSPGFTCSETASDPILLEQECDVRFGRPAGSKMAVYCGNRSEQTANGTTTITGQRALTVEQL